MTEENIQGYRTSTKGIIYIYITGISEVDEKKEQKKYLK